MTVTSVEENAEEKARRQSGPRLLNEFANSSASPKDDETIYPPVDLNSEQEAVTVPVETSVLSSASVEKERRSLLIILKVQKTGSTFFSHLFRDFGSDEGHYPVENFDADFISQMTEKEQVSESLPTVFFRFILLTWSHIGVYLDFQLSLTSSTGDAKGCRDHSSVHPSLHCLVANSASTQSQQPG